MMEFLTDFFPLLLHLLVASREQVLNSGRRDTKVHRHFSCNFTRCHARCGLHLSCDSSGGRRDALRGLCGRIEWTEQRHRTDFSCPSRVRARQASPEFRNHMFSRQCEQRQSQRGPSIPTSSSPCRTPAPRCHTHLPKPHHTLHKRVSNSARSCSSCRDDANLHVSIRIHCSRLSPPSPAGKPPQRNAPEPILYMQMASTPYVPPKPRTHPAPHPHVQPQPQPPQALHPVYMPDQEGRPHRPSQSCEHSPTVGLPERQQWPEDKSGKSPNTRDTDDKMRCNCSLLCVAHSILFLFFLK